MNISFDHYSLMIDGKRLTVRSGAMHYFRLPHPDLWRSRILALKAAGYNAIDLYFNWDFHSPAPGVYCFDGIRDVRKLLTMVKDAGLYLIARPGPYINAETTRGGMPGWLLSEPDVILRNREDGQYRYSPPYMHFVKEWMDHILPIIAEQPNLLMIQVENEYSTEEMEPDTMLALIEMIRSHGITVPTMHNDFYAAGLYADLVDIYALDNYSVTVFDEVDWRQFPHLLSVIDHLAETLREDVCLDRPLMVTELQAGWFAGWQGASYETIRARLGREHIGLVTRSFLGQGGTLFNHYKAVGGTNWGHLGATDVCTSYDFAAPFSEEGLPTERYHEAKRLNLLLMHFDLTQTHPVPPGLLNLPEDDLIYKVREVGSQPRSAWLFIRNFTTLPQHLKLNDAVTVSLLPAQMRILPWDISLKSGWTLVASNIEALVDTPSFLMLAADAEPISFILRPPELIDDLPESEPFDLQIQPTSGDMHISLPLGCAANEILTLALPGLTVYVLGSDQADRLWMLPDGTYAIGAEMVFADRLYHRAQAYNDTFILEKSGQLKRLPPPDTTPFSVPLLNDWNWTSVGFSKAEFNAISSAGADMDHNGFYEGAVCYRYLIPEGIKTLTLWAQHIWAVYQGTHCLSFGNVLRVKPDIPTPDDAVMLTLRDDTPRELLIYVESMGHNKGFYDDTREPRGILSLVTDTAQDIALIGRIKACDYSAPADSENPALFLLGKTTFVLNLPTADWAPIGLDLVTACERVDIILNGLLIGKYWHTYGHQKRFYLPDGVLNKQGENHLELRLMDVDVHQKLESERKQGHTLGTLICYDRLIPYP